MKMKKAFTLIELLVVIAIIGLLMAIVVPGLRKAKEYAKKVICQSNQRQLGIAIGSYESQFSFNFRENTKWYFENGTGDLPYEPQSKYARDLMKNRMLPDRKVFFCPAVRGITHENNYRYNQAVSGNTTVFSVSSTEWLMETDSTFNDRPAFWSTYAWLWKKGASDHPNSSLNPNNVNMASSGVLLTDVPDSFWNVAISIGNNDAKLLTNIFGVSEGAIQTLPHGNVLMKDLSVNNPADRDEELNRWLWNTPTWAGN